MKTSQCTSYEDLPLFLNARDVAQVLGVSISTAYELFHETGFPVLRVGSRMVKINRTHILKLCNHPKIELFEKSWCSK